MAFIVQSSPTPMKANCAISSHAKAVTPSLVHTNNAHAVFLICLSEACWRSKAGLNDGNIVMLMGNLGSHSDISTCCKAHGQGMLRDRTI